MSTTDYKGFKVEFRSNGITIDTGRYFVEADGFNPNGYATLNNAHGAITKLLKATSDDKAIASLPIVMNVDNLTAMLRYHGFLNADGTPRKRDNRSRNKREGGYAGKRASYTVDPTTGNLSRKAPKHFRSNGKHFDTLKTYGKFLKSLDLGI